MKTLEQIARRMCSIDLQAKGFPETELPGLVDRFWPVTANEIREGVSLIGEWPFSAEDIRTLEEQYRALSPS